MKQILSFWLVGLLFSLGLGLSGMTQPQKIFEFLDIFGDWNPTLMFVMAGAVTVHFITFRLIRKRSSPLLSPHWHLSQKTKITPSLVIGAIIFGAGWGLGGYCPGPGVTSLASLQFRPAIFIGCMLVGMLLFKKLDQKIRFNR